MAIISIFCLLELWGHWHSNSLSLLADSVHLFVDILGFVVSLVSLSLTKLSKNSRYMFGYHRFEVIGALFSISLIWIATIYLICESINRLKNPKEINEKSFIMIAIVGFLVNLFCLHSLHRNDCQNTDVKNLNMKATYVHIIGDLIQSIGVLIASTLTFFFPKIIFFDIAATMIFAIIVIISTFYVVSEGMRILLETCPDKIDIKKLESDILKVKNVLEIEDLKVWSISVSKSAITLKIKSKDIKLDEHHTLLNNLEKLLSKKYDFSYSTIQINSSEHGFKPFSNCDEQNCDEQCSSYLNEHCVQIECEDQPK
ncbi:Cation Diffusion Facilitator (CDF) Transporter [Pseudoloma neurophilia]|uniref:Cation Diffusion Facilitator (CDF) Transporter n=1 Tax=Pseudoloma neurophilia TaxID=146866 RepID=A0A0R0M7Z1_9MICR|nr:Cation Diffusion Facilitator (CDF) Transporter [Pseudoloma neurophilia]